MSQLKMQRQNLDDLREIVLPSGYQIRSYREGDEAAWAHIVNNSLGGQWNAESCHRDLTGCPQFRPKGLFFAIHKDKPVGTTCAWTGSVREKEIGNVHMVGVVPEHRGKRLGYALCLSVLHFLKENKFKRAVLNTDDFRLPAIKTYLNLGFEPEYADDDHEERWKAIFAKLEIADDK